ncbi:sensor histidine kinase [Aquihabitans sp. McL0605]|uniref:sensor histidine kinase n=1 Tax=Aquihabitans sp. McL0605 TaxID=3415671 RepID=UPI003CE9F9B1
MNDVQEGDAALAARQLAHDLLQSLTIIRATIATYRLGHLGPSIEPVLGVIEREVGVMAGLCEEEVHGTPLAAPIDPRVIATSVVERMRTAYSGELRLDLDGIVDAPSLRGSVTEWERSLLNLVENGCRAAGPDGKVLVRCSSTNESLTIAVADSGPGFGEAPAGRSSLGMVAVMRLVEHHGGHLELRRSDLGGAQLTVVLPLHPNP